MRGWFVHQIFLNHHSVLIVCFLFFLQLYDINSDGKVTLDEMEEISKAIYSLLGYYVTPVYDKKTSSDHAKRVFEKLDPHHKGYVSLQEFLDVCSNVSFPSILSSPSLPLFSHPLSIFLPLFVFFTSPFQWGATSRKEREKKSHSSKAPQFMFTSWSSSSPSSTSSDHLSSQPPPLLCSAIFLLLILPFRKWELIIVVKSCQKLFAP